MARVEKSNSVVASFKEEKKQRRKVETEERYERKDIICLDKKNVFREEPLKKRD